MNHMRLFITFLVLCTINSSLLAQDWETIETPVTSNLILYDICFPPGQNDIGYTVGSNVTYNGQGKILKTTNGGLDWTVIWESTTNGTGMESVCFVTPLIGYAGAMNGNVMKTVNGGSTWSSTDFAMGVDQGSILDIEFYDLNNGVLSSQWEGIYVTSNGGASWTQATTNALSVYDLCYANATTLFAAQNGQDIMKSTNGGMTWTLSYSGPNMFGLNLGVHFSDINNGLVTSEEGTVFVTTNSGANWTQQTVPGQFGLMRGAWVFDANNMYATGTPGQVYVTSNGGTTWSEDSPLDFDPSYYKIIFTANGTGFVSGSGSSGGTILRKAGGGGCTDSLACNYDSEETVDDGSCIYPDGCTNPEACNYDANALCDNGECILPDGCTDSEACNYEDWAECDNGSCFYPDDIYDCNGTCWNDEDNDGICDELEVEGCTDSEACNYDSAANEDDGSCYYPNGCTDSEACNYDSLANCDDGSCYYPSGCGLLDACNYDSMATCPDNDSCLFPDGCTDPEACNYDSSATCDDGSCYSPIGCGLPNACNYDSMTECPDNDSCILPDGCADSEACNYDSLATCDDGSCYYPSGCGLPNTCNYDSMTVCPDNDSCIFPDGCTDPGACNFAADALCNDGSCEYVEALTISGNVVVEPFVDETYTYPETAGSTYEWTIVGGSIISGQGTSSIVVLWDYETMGTVTVVETNTMGCEGPAVELTVDIINSVFERSNNLSFTIYPNPTQDFITLEFSNTNTSALWTVTNSLGQQIRTGRTSQKTTIDLSDCASGVYFVRVWLEGVVEVGVVVRGE